MWFAAVCLHASALGIMWNLYRRASQAHSQDVLQLLFATAIMVITWSFDLALFSRILIH